MIFRFSLYSFLRRQEFFAPFMVLAFLQKGLTFQDIGWLVSVREICINVMEIPSGAIADVMGRKKTLTFSLLSYAAAFFIFGMAGHFGWLCAAMVLYGVGEAFRTGTHKAMIFAWLASVGRTKEKKTIYGITRSWGKVGAALSIIPATLFVFFSGDYNYVFYISIVPFLLNAFNIATYPKYIDSIDKKSRIIQVFKKTIASFCESFRVKALRSVILECMSYESLFKLSKDYVQPVIKSMALAIPMFLSLADEKRTALLIGGIYFVMHFAGAWTSRQSARFVDWAGDRRATCLMWSAEAALFLLMLAGMMMNAAWLMVLAFVLIQIKQNLWKPVLVCRCSDICRDDQMATVLSIQSQSKAVMLAVIAPLLGWFVDGLTRQTSDLQRFLPLPILGLIVSFTILINVIPRPKKTTAM